MKKTFEKTLTALQILKKINRKELLNGRLDRFSNILGLKNHAVTRIRTWVASATTKSTNHYTITAIGPLMRCCKLKKKSI